MTFTFAIPFDDISRVRYKLGDTDEAAASFTDELIAAVTAEEDGSWKRAAVSLLKSRIAQMGATPNFTADWLKADVNTQIANDRKLLADLLAEFGEETAEELPTMTTEAAYVYRVDTGQTEPPYGA